jgi:hypothetical protein
MRFSSQQATSWSMQSLTCYEDGRPAPQTSEISRDHFFLTPSEARIVLARSSIRESEALQHFRLRR